MSTISEKKIEDLEDRESLLRKAVENLRRAGYGYNHDLSQPIQKEISRLDEQIQEIDQNHETGEQ